MKIKYTMLYLFLGDNSNTKEEGLPSLCIVNELTGKRTYHDRYNYI